MNEPNEPHIIGWNVALHDDTEESVFQIEYLYYDVDDEHPFDFNVYVFDKRVKNVELQVSLADKIDQVDNIGHAENIDLSGQLDNVDPLDQADNVGQVNQVETQRDDMLLHCMKMMKQTMPPNLTDSFAITRDHLDSIDDFMALFNGQFPLLQTDPSFQEQVIKLFKKLRKQELIKEAKRVRSAFNMPRAKDDAAIRLTILIRTCNRKALFAQCMQSIYSQTHKNVRIVVAYVEGTAEYVKEYNDIEHVVLPSGNEGTPFFYNGHCNALLDYAGDTGWTMFMDDDDEYFDDRAFEIICRYISKGTTRNVFCWNFLRADKIIRLDKVFRIRYGQIGTPMVCFHSTFRKHRWPQRKGGDFGFFSQFWKLCDPVRIPLALVACQYDDKICGDGKC